MTKTTEIVSDSLRIAIREIFPGAVITEAAIDNGEMIIRNLQPHAGEQYQAFHRLGALLERDEWDFRLTTGLFLVICKRRPHNGWADGIEDDLSLAILGLCNGRYSELGKK